MVGELINNGEVAPDNSIGVLTVKIYTGSGTLELEGDLDGGDMLIVTRTGTGSAVKKAIFIPTGYFRSGSNVIDLKNFVSGNVDISNVTIDGEDVSGATLSVKKIEQTGPARYRFDAERIATCEGLASNANATSGAIAAAKALDSNVDNVNGDTMKLIAVLDDLADTGDLTPALDQLHPEGYDSLLYAVLGNNQRLSSMIASRMTGINRRLDPG